VDRRVRDQRPGRPTGIEFRGDATEKIIDVGSAVTPAALGELNAADILPIHWPPLSRISGSITQTACIHVSTGGASFHCSLRC
jgi:hypothetical protein